MRARVAGSLAILVGLGLCSAFAAGCGGGTPPPKDESDVASTNSASGSDNSPAASHSPAAIAAPQGSDAPPSSNPAPAASTAASGDIKPDGDDPWLAAHQMPAGDVMKTLHGASAKVQACWKAGLQRDPSCGGDVKIRFVVQNDGKVRVWRDDGSSMTDEDVTNCIGGVVEKLKFPQQKSPGDAWGVYTIHLGP